jgi:hypothetical protein
MTPDVVPTRKSILGKEVEAPPASVAFPTKRAQPIVPIPEPFSFQLSEDLERTPRTAGEVKVKPLVAAPATHAAPSFVTQPRSVPEVAESASAGMLPEKHQITPVVKMLFNEPVVSSMVFAPVLRLIFAIDIIVSSRD